MLMMQHCVRLPVSAFSASPRNTSASLEAGYFCGLSGARFTALFTSRLIAAASPERSFDTEVSVRCLSSAGFQLRRNFGEAVPGIDDDAARGGDAEGQVGASPQKLEYTLPAASRPPVMRAMFSSIVSSAFTV